MLNRVRNIKKRWLAVFAVVALLALGLVSGVALAANSSDHPYEMNPAGYHYSVGHMMNGPDLDVLARVSEIVDVEQTTLESAFATAYDERADVRFTDYARSLVEDETLTQEQADAATTWFDARPSNSGPIAILLAFTANSGFVDDLLSRMVEHGRITQEEADALSGWHENRPDAIPQEERGRFGHRKGHHDAGGEFADDDD